MFGGLCLVGDAIVAQIKLLAGLWCIETCCAALSAAVTPLETIAMRPQIHDDHGHDGALECEDRQDADAHKLWTRWVVHLVTRGGGDGSSRGGRRCSGGGGGGGHGRGTRGSHLRRTQRMQLH